MVNNNHVARRLLGWLGLRCRRCYRYCGILLIAVACLTLNIRLYLFQYVISLTSLLFYHIYH